ncbi:MAG: galactose-1-epimerase, partial [Thermoanaerobaculia bacterium]|nr:galactose-1-epimerase [Thermoanaerobaculia bacterium]
MRLFLFYLLLLNSLLLPAQSSLLPRAENFTKTIGGKAVSLYYLRNDRGMEVAITNYGGRIVSLVVPDRYDQPTDVVSGYNSLDEYLNNPEEYFGAIIGRYANRIAGGKFTLDGKEYKLAQNNGPNHLHGG